MTQTHPTPESISHLDKYFLIRSDGSVNPRYHFWYDLAKEVL